MMAGKICAVKEKNVDVCEDDFGDLRGERN